MKPVDGVVVRKPARDRRSHGVERDDDAFVADPGHLTKADRANLLKYMAMMRAAEERAITLYRQGKIPGSFYDG